MSKRTYRSPEQWRALIHEQAQSELTVATYCQQHGLSSKTFYRQRRKLSGDHMKKEAAPTFIQALKVTPTSTAKSELVLHYGHSHLVLPTDSNPILIANIMRELA